MKSLIASGALFLAAFAGSAVVLTDCANTSAGIYSQVESANSGSTVCIDAGTYNLSRTLSVPSGVSVVGATGTSTMVKGRATDPDPIVNLVSSAQVGVSAGDNVSLRWLDISGATGTSSCIPGCGRGVESGNNLRASYLELHGNLVQGIGGMGDGSVIYRSEIYNNGSSIATGVNSGGIKSGSTFAVIESYGHDNVGNTFWCDNDCLGADPSAAFGYTFAHDFTVKNSVTGPEGRNGVRFEHGNGASDAEAAASRALIQGNVIIESNRTCNNPGAGVEINSASNATVKFNEFGGTNKSTCSPTGGNGVAVRGSRHPLKNNVVTDNNMGKAQGYSICDKVSFSGTGTVARNTC